MDIIKSFRNIINFGISYNNDNDLKKALNDASFKYVNIDNSLLLIANIDIITMKHYNGKYDNESFIFYNNKEFEYWEKENKDLKYDKNTNPYILKEYIKDCDYNETTDTYTIGSKVSIRLNYLNEIDKAIESNLNKYHRKFPNTIMTDEQLISQSMKPLGGFSSYRYRKYLYNEN